MHSATLVDTKFQSLNPLPWWRLLVSTTTSSLDRERRGVFHASTLSEKYTSSFSRKRASTHLRYGHEIIVVVSNHANHGQSVLGYPRTGDFSDRVIPWQSIIEMGLLSQRTPDVVAEESLKLSTKTVTCLSSFLQVAASSVYLSVINFCMACMNVVSPSV